MSKDKQKSKSDVVAKLPKFRIARFLFVFAQLGDVGCERLNSQSVRTFTLHKFIHIYSRLSIFGGESALLGEEEGGSLFAIRFKQ